MGLGYETSTVGGPPVIIFTTHETNIAGCFPPDADTSELPEPELFPENRPKGPMSHAFEAAQRFAERMRGGD